MQHEMEVTLQTVERSEAEKMSDKRVSRMQGYMIPPRENRTYKMQREKSVPAKKNSEGSGFCAFILMGVSLIVILLTFPLSACACIKVVQEYERAVIFRLGRLKGGAKGPGLFLVVPCTDEYRQIDLRTRTFDVPPQEILTKDSVTVAMDAVVYYRVKDAIMSVANVENVDGATRLLAQTTLRNMLGTKSLSEILTSREQIAEGMLEGLEEATAVWGIQVERIEIKDVRLPKQLQRAMAAEAEASREAKAKVIAAEGEKNASIKLKEAADVMATAPSAMQLRFLQTLTTISAEKNQTVILPVPIDLLGRIDQRFSKSNLSKTKQNNGRSLFNHSHSNQDESMKEIDSSLPDSLNS